MIWEWIAVLHTLFHGISHVYPISEAPNVLDYICRKTWIVIKKKPRVEFYIFFSRSLVCNLEEVRTEQATPANH